MSEPAGGRPPNLWSWLKWRLLVGWKPPADIGPQPKWPCPICPSNDGAWCEIAGHYTGEDNRIIPRVG